MTPTVDVGANDVDFYSKVVDVGGSAAHYRTLDRNRQGPDVDFIPNSVD